MHPAVSVLAENAFKHQHLFSPLLFVILGAVGAVNVPVQHSLLVTAVSWALIWIPLVFRTGIWGSASTSNGKINKTSTWLAGAFLALAQVCDSLPHVRVCYRSSSSSLPNMEYS
jgi:hypothetical protein